MQKRYFIFLFLVAIGFLYSSIAEAALQYLPRYQGSYGARLQDGGKDKVIVTCSSKGGVEKGANQTCSGAISGVNNCYQSCSCNTGYKMSGGSCISKGCSDYGYLANEDPTKSCEQKTLSSGITCYSCIACNTSTYKYACSGGLNASSQTETSCNSLYSKCTCVNNADWNGSACECGGNFKRSGNSCILKTCEDYGYLDFKNKDNTKQCSYQNPFAGLECWNCSACTGTLYDCGTISNNNGADTSSMTCGGKYARCKCKTGYFWNSGKCEKSCTASSCTGSSACGGKSCTIFKPSAISAANELGNGVGAYQSCTPINCSGDTYQYGYLPTDCASGFYGYDIGTCPTPKNTDCVSLGYTQTTCSAGKTPLKCPFDFSKIACMSF